MPLRAQTMPFEAPNTVALLLLLECQLALQAVVLVLLVLLCQCGVVGALLQLGQ